MRRIVDILGVPVDRVTMQEALDKATSLIEKGFPCQVVTPNSIIIVKARRDRQLLNCLKAASLTLPDGAGLVWASKLFKNPLPQRVTGIDFMLQLTKKAADRGCRIYFLGGRAGVAEKAAENLKKQHPDLKIVGCRHGYFRSQETSEIITAIKKSGAHILFVGLGAVKQELWIYENLSELGVPLCIGIGGSFDVVAGRLKRAPRVWQKMGLEWLYRFFQEPWRWPHLLSLLKFIYLSLSRKIFIERRRHTELSCDRINILGTPVDPLTREQVITRIIASISLRRKTFIVAINPEKIMKARQDRKLKAILNQAQLCIADGTGILLAGKILGRPIPTRITGIDLMVSLVELAAAKGYRLYILGGKPGVAAETAKIWQEEYSSLKIVGIQHGYYNKEDEINIREKIIATRADLLFVALGSPSQEYWIVNNQDKVGVPICMGVGGSLDVVTGRLLRAPRWLQSLGLEWAYRLAKEPWRWRRMLVLPLYIWLVLKEKKKKNGRLKR